MKMKTNQTEELKWYRYVSAFFAGAFLANFIPHYVQGISGNPFPSPFGSPPGFGNSSPTSNVLWGAFNLLIGYLLFRVSKIDKKQRLALFIFYTGIIAQGIMLSLAFSNKN
jgi:hypothetical protein